MERSQGFITIVFRALAGSRHKTRRRQVTRIPPTPVPKELHTPATLSDSPPCKALVGDATQDVFVAKWLTTLEEDPSEEPNPNNDLGESYVAEIQWSSKHIPLICTNAEEHEHLTNHFNDELNVKISDMFTDLFSNINMDNIQETYSKISIYSKVIGQYVDETNLKYGLNLKFTELESPEVGLWAKTFQVVGHIEDQQTPKEQQSEPPRPQMTMPTSELPVIEQWVETTRWPVQLPSGLIAHL